MRKFIAFVLVLLFVITLPLALLAFNLGRVLFDGALVKRVVTNWAEIAFWLQNRGIKGKTPNPRNYPWLNPAWFPPMLKDKSFAVFTFTYRGCKSDGCRTLGGWQIANG